MWQRDLLGEWAVVRIYGRRDDQQQVRVTPFPSLVEAWPTIRAHIRTRLRHGYRIAHTHEKSETIRPGSL
ncbi:MAG: WGR domain-containing protein [Chloroflexota bacterium]